MSIPACHVGDLGSIPRRSDRRGHLENTRRSACDNRPFLFVHILLVIRPNLSQRRGLCCGGQNTRHAQKQKTKKIKKNESSLPGQIPKSQLPNSKAPKNPQRARRDALPLSAPDGMPFSLTAQQKRRQRSQRALHNHSPGVGEGGSVRPMMVSLVAFFFCQS